MKALEELWRAPWTLSDPWHWSYALVFAGLGAFLLWLRRDSAPRGPLLARLFPKKIWRHPSVRHDFVLAVTNRLASALIFVPFFVFAVHVSSGTESFLRGQFGRPVHLDATPLTLFAFGLFDLLLADFALFCTHWLGHRFGPFWAFHKVHHSAPVLTPFTAERFHPLEALQDFLTMELTVGIATGVAGWLSGGALHPIEILAVNAFNVVWNVTGSHLRHSHIPLHYPRWLSHVLISPVMHQVHHSEAEHHHNKNLGVVFAFWDWAAGTLHVPERGEVENYGLGEDGADHSTLGGLWLRPFIDVFRRR